MSQSETESELLGMRLMGFEREIRAQNAVLIGILSQLLSFGAISIDPLISHVEKHEEIVRNINSLLSNSILTRLILAQKKIKPEDRRKSFHLVEVEQDPDLGVHKP